jgi:hypothetical protein
LESGDKPKVKISFVSYPATTIYGSKITYAIFRKILSYIDTGIKITNTSLITPKEIQIAQTQEKSVVDVPITTRVF